jgi:ribonuclease P/MRP protein subunit RPP1
MKDINLFKKKNSLHFKKVRSKKDLLSNDDCDGYLIESSEAEARRIIESLKAQKIKKKIAFVGGDDSFNRRALEKLKIDYLVSPEAKTGFDTLKQRDSGLNHVTAKIAAKNKIGIVFDVGEISKLDGKDLAVRLEKIIQNIKIARRAKCSIKIASFGRDKKEVVSEIARRSFGVSLGMSSSQSRDCVGF